MKLIFIDDSGQRTPRRHHLGPLVALGAVIVPSSEIASFAADMDEIKRRLGVPSDEELKWKPAKNTFMAKAGGELATELRVSMLEAAIARNITSVVHVLDHSMVYKDRTVVEVGQELLKWTYDKVAWGLDADGAIMIADKPGGGTAEESRWLASTLSLTNDGTAYTAPGKIILPVLTAESHHVPHLQLADLVTAATTAAIAGHSSGLYLAPWLLRLARKNDSGYIGGAGVSLWPPDLKDLLYWTFGEERYVRAGEETLLGPDDSPFAAPGRPFKETSGLDGT